MNIGEIERLPDCGECAGCKIDAMIKSGLAEIDAFFESRARSLNETYDRRDYLDEESYCKHARALQREWSARRWDFIRAMKPIGCIRIAYILPPREVD